jgi:hypothetical protein
LKDISRKLVDELRAELSLVEAGGVFSHLNYKVILEGRPWRFCPLMIGSADIRETSAVMAGLDFPSIKAREARPNLS